MTINELLILGYQNPAKFVFTYFQVYDEVNPIIISTPTEYQNSTNPQIIYVEMLSLITNFYIVAEFEIEVNILSTAFCDVDSEINLYPNPTAGQALKPDAS